MDFDDLFAHGIGETYAKRVPVDSMLYLEHTITSGSTNVSYRKNSGSLIVWPNNTTVSFNSNDTVSIRIELNDMNQISHGVIELKLNSSTGRSVADFNYEINKGHIE